MLKKARTIQKAKTIDTKEMDKRLNDMRKQHETDLQEIKAASENLSLQFFIEKSKDNHNVYCREVS